MSLLSTWQFNILLFYFCSVLYSQYYRRVAKNTKNEGAATIALQGLAGLSILLLVPLFPLKAPDSSKTFILLATACVFYAITDRLQTTVRKHLEVSKLSIIMQLTNVFLIAIGIVFFRDPVVAVKLLGAGMILCSSAWIFYKKGSGKFRIDKYSLMAVSSSFFFAIAISIDIGISKQFNLPLYIAITLLVPSLFIAIGEKLNYKAVVAEYNHGDKSLYLKTSVFWALTIFFSLRAFALGKVAIIVPLETMAVFLNVLAGYIWLDEKDEVTKKILAALVAISGVALTVM
jgi:uncharacterized membrane protein